MSQLNLIDTAIKTGIFQTFTKLLEGSVLEKKLRSRNTFTLFAPVDTAFAYPSTEMLNCLLRAESDGMLADVLSYHVVPLKIMSCDLRNLRKAMTSHGAELAIDNDKEVRVGGAKLLHVDILARNGVIHGIDRVLLPSSFAAAARR